MSDLVCVGDERRAEVRRRGSNGVDYLEVSDDQTVLTVTFLGKAPNEVAIENVRIEGGRRVRGIRIVDVRLCREDDPDLDDCMRVTVDRPGDFSTYTLRLVDEATPKQPMPGLDPRYASLDFTFKVGCPSDLDCGAPDECPVESSPEPDISRLAKDYASFRSLILDRLAVLMPDWTERHVPDLEIALVELLAYVGDQLSYHQDAVATEAYLDTARRRISVRRHTRLVDYVLHDGCNARAWVCVEVDGPGQVKASDVCFVTAPEVTPFPSTALGCDELRVLQAGGSAVFEPVADWRWRQSSGPSQDAMLSFDPSHNLLHFWTWGDGECCLPAGATRATLKDAWVQPRLSARGTGARERALSLAPGDVLIFEERIGPATGNPADADPRHRQAVRLTGVRLDHDPLYDQPVVEVEWSPEDALEFSLCISTYGGEDCAPIEDVSVALGNVVLVDHGATVDWCDDTAEPLSRRTALHAPVGCDGPCEPTDRAPVPAPYGATLMHRPVSQVTPFPSVSSVARCQAAAMGAIPARVRARLDGLLKSVGGGNPLGDERRRELGALFGSRVLADLLRAGDGQELEPLERIVGDADHLLADKQRRTTALAEGARDGDVLPMVVAEELEELWGPLYAFSDALFGPGALGPASGVLLQDPREALPALWIDEVGARGESNRWESRRDLFHSGPDDRHVVGETDDDEALHLRFGPGVREVPVDRAMTAHYRVGNGRAGNVGPDAISRIVFRTSTALSVSRVRNPLAAGGGIDPEPLSTARLSAPTAFRRVRERAITAADYAELASAVADVQGAASRLRWTGGWFEAHVGLDVLSGASRPYEVPAAVSARLEPVRRLGHDLRVEPAVTTPIDLALTICVAQDYRVGAVRQQLLDALSNRALPGGTLGFFHPDRLTFGSDIRISELIAVAQAVPGVELVKVTGLRRVFDTDGLPPDGILGFGPLEIPELANDPNDPERGKLELEMRGGR